MAYKTWQASHKSIGLFSYYMSPKAYDSPKLTKAYDKIVEEIQNELEMMAICQNPLIKFSSRVSHSSLALWVYNHVYFKTQFSLITEALKLYGERLSEWERNEVRKYPEVWFLGLESNKVQARANLPNNCGFDDENGSYNKVGIANLRLFSSKHIERRPLL